MLDTSGISLLAEFKPALRHESMRARKVGRIAMNSIDGGTNVDPGLEEVAVDAKAATCDLSEE